MVVEGSKNIKRKLQGGIGSELVLCLLPHSVGQNKSHGHLWFKGQISRLHSLMRGTYGQFYNLLQRHRDTLPEVVGRRLVYFGSPSCLVGEWFTYYPSTCIHKVQETMELCFQVSLSLPTHVIMKLSIALYLIRFLPPHSPKNKKQPILSSKAKPGLESWVFSQLPLLSTHPLIQPHILAFLAVPD